MENQNSDKTLNENEIEIKRRRRMKTDSEILSKSKVSLAGPYGEKSIPLSDAKIGLYRKLWIESASIKNRPQFKCQFCERSFYSRSYLLIHLKTRKHYVERQR